MFTLEQYFGTKPHTEAQEVAATALLVKVNALQAEYRDATGRPEDIDPDTGTEISGSKGGSGDGGFRLDTATTGGGHSAHKIVWEQNSDGSWRKELETPKAAVDCSDQRNKLDDWLDGFEYGDGQNSMLEKHDLYREHPSATPTWCHLTDRAPHSGRRTYMP